MMVEGGYAMRWWRAGSVGLLVFWATNGAMAETIQGRALIKGADDHRDIVVYLDGLKEDVTRGARPAVEVDQHKLVFDPHVLPIVVGSAVDIKNSDTLLHDIFLLDTDGTRHPFRSFGQDSIRSYLFEKPGIATLLCRRHQEMWASIVVLSNPYYAVTDRDGRYEIRGVPPGSYTLTAWHEQWHPVSRQVSAESGRQVTVDFQLGSLVADRE